MKFNCDRRIAAACRWLIMLLLVVLLPSLAAGDPAPSPKELCVLMIHSSSIDKTRETDIDSSFMRAMLNLSSEPFSYYQLELHADIWPESSSMAVLQPFMPPLKAGQFAAVITIGNEAADIIKKCRDEIPESTLVYNMALVQNNNPAPGSGNAIMPSIRETCELAARLFPERRNIVILTDGAEDSRRMLKGFADSAASGYTVNIFSCRETEADEVIEFVKKHAADSIVLFHQWPRKRSDQDEVGMISEMSAAVRVPIFVLRRSRIRFGAVGGVVISGQDIGAAAAADVLAALSGRRDKAAFNNAIRPRTILDWHALSAFEVPAKRIPDNAIVENRPPVFWQLHLDELLFAAGSVFFLLAALLFIMILRIKRHQKKSEEYTKQLKTALEAAHAAERAKTDFLSTMSHEIRTPLNAVIGFAELLRDDTLPPDERFDYLEAIQFSSNALLDLINDILDLAKLDVGRLKIKKSNVDLDVLFHEIKTIFSQQSKEKRIEFIVSLPPDSPTVLTDPVRLRQIILNLVGNAFKFTEHGSIELGGKYVPAADSTGTGVLTIQVRDTGIGMKPEFLTKLFTPFTQANDINSTEKQTGTGLGLSISQRLAKAMNGKLLVDSTYGKGSCFTLELSDIAAASKAVSRKNEQNAQFLTDLKYSILIVDDQPLNLTVLDRMLRKFGLDPVTANSARKALKQFERNPFDIVMTDLKMPKMSGCELAAAIRGLPQGKSTKIFVVTADIYADTGHNLDAFDGVLTKPLTLEKLNRLFTAVTRSTNNGGMLLNELRSNGGSAEK